MVCFYTADEMLTNQSELRPESCFRPWCFVCFNYPGLLIARLPLDYLDCENIYFGRISYNYRSCLLRFSFLQQQETVLRSRRENPSRKVTDVGIVFNNKITNRSHVLISVYQGLIIRISRFLCRKCSDACTCCCLRLYDSVGPKTGHNSRVVSLIKVLAKSDK